MPIMFWVELSSLAISTLVAASLTVTILGAGTRKPYTTWFAAFSVFQLCWSALSLVMRIRLWVGLPIIDMVAELSTIIFTVMAMSAFGFAVTYARKPVKHPLPYVLPGLALLLFLFTIIRPEGVVDSITLMKNGLIHVQFDVDARIWGVIPGLYLLAAIVVLHFPHDRKVISSFILGNLYLLIGLLAYGLPLKTIPLMTYTNMFSLLTFGYAVVTMQVFNPLVETTESLRVEIAERERISDELATSETNLRTLVDSMYDMLVVCTDEGHILHMNQQFQSSLAFTQSELDSLSFYMFVAPAERDVMRAMISQVTDDSYTEVFFAQSQLGNTRGEFIDVDVQITQGFWSGSPVVYIILRDITEQLKDIAEINRLRLLLENVMMAMPSALIMLDPEYRIQSWNPQAVELTGLAADDAMHRCLWELCPTLKVFDNLVDEVLESHTTVHNDRQLIRINNQDLYCDVTVFPLITDQLAGAVMRIDNVTERVNMEDMMYQSAKLASIGRLAAGVAHEINNPIGGILQSAQIIQMALDVDRKRTSKLVTQAGVDPDGLRRYLDSRNIVAYLDGIRESGARASKIVSDLLSFSRRSLTNFAPRNFNDLVRQALALAETDYDFNKQYDFKNIQLALDLSAGEPQIICDGQQIQQVILNLVRNAAQAMIERSQSETDYVPRLGITTLDLGEYVRFSVSDNGPGIALEVRGRLFEPFVSTKEVGSGTGLGLWMSWSIIQERHQGRIWLEEAQGQGTTFIVELLKSGPTTGGTKMRTFPQHPQDVLE